MLTVVPLLRWAERERERERERKREREKERERERERERREGERERERGRPALGRGYGSHGISWPLRFLRVAVSDSYAMCPAPQLTTQG